MNTFAVFFLQNLYAQVFLNTSSKKQCEFFKRFSFDLGIASFTYAEVS